MTPVLYYPHRNRNVGRIKSINEGQLTVSINAGHGGGEMMIPTSNCLEFEPQVDDRVLLVVDDDGEVPGFFLQRIKKTR